LASSFRTLRARFGAGPLVFAAALPFLFLHRHYQPSFAAGGVEVTLADVALLAVVATAAVESLRNGLEPVRHARAVWLLLGLFMAWIFLSLLWARSNDHAYAIGSHVVSALKFFEFALLAPAVPLVLRRRGDLRVLFVALTAWSVFITAVALLQFLGVLDEFEGRRPLQREPSYVGVHELGALSGATLGLAFAALLVGRWRRRSAVAVVAGGLGVALAAALDSVGGVVAAAATLWGVTRARGAVPARRTIALCVIVLTVGVAAVSLRGTAVTALLEFLGVRAADQQTQTHVQTYAHRTLLGYIGIEIWLDHPIVGVGWQESLEPAAFTPHLAQAHRRFPTEPAQAFPAANHKWGIQNGIIQTAADLGVVGLALLLAAVAAAFRLALRAALDRRTSETEEALAAIAWLWVSFAVFTGLLAGASVDTLLWLAIGLTVAVSARPLHETLTARR
jgi:hypothetical protein